MEAFQLAIFLPTGQDFDLDQFVTNAAQQRGRVLFFGGAAKCSECHGGSVMSTASAGLGGGNKKFNTGVVNLPINSANITAFGPLPAEDSGNREFSTPEMFGVRDTGPFFHDNSVTTLREAVAFYDTSQFSASPGSTAVGGLTLTQTNVDDIVAFLEGLVEPVTGPTFSISGTVTLEGRTGTSGGGVGHGLAVVSASPGVFKASVRADGTFEFPRMPANTYTLTASALGFVSAQRTGVVVAAANITVPARQLPAGRVNSDAVININDISAAAASNGASQCCRRDAQGLLTDVDGDGGVDSTDIGLVATNFGTTGPVNWP
jgi:hypothetical protein